MKNDYLNNKIKYSLNADLNTTHKLQKIIKSNNVDINKLLNRLKIDQRNKKKENLILTSLISSVLLIIGTIITL